jgi:hypothetical protein
MNYGSRALVAFDVILIFGRSKEERNDSLLHVVVKTLPVLTIQSVLNLALGNVHDGIAFIFHGLAFNVGRPTERPLIRGGFGRYARTAGTVS